MHLKLFTTEICPNCPAVKRKLEQLLKYLSNIKADFINASTEDGLAIAKQCEVSNVPTVIFYDNDIELGRAKTCQEIETFFQTLPKETFASIK